jgi:choline dehydrogenase-like flavoprotein
LKLPEVDAVIVGAGAAGGVLAQELSRAGLHVALLERGGYVDFGKAGHDELYSQRTTVLGNAFGPDDEHYVRTARMGDSKEFRKVLPSEGDYGNVAACVGGGTQSYGAMAWRFMPQDFKMRSTYGAPEGSSLEDWPITYEDLEPFYERAEHEIGVSGKAKANPFEAPRKNGYPMPPLPYNQEADRIHAAAQRLGWHPFPIPMAINSVEYGGRSACIMCPHCVGFACEVNAKGSTAVTVIPRAIQTGNSDLRTGCVAKEVLTDARGRATGVAYYKNEQDFEQPAKLVVVSCSATESARLLLNSRSRLHPAGLGNQNGWVGKNLQGHAYTGAWGLFDEPLWDGLGPAARVAMCDFNHGNAGLRGGALLSNEFIRMPYLFARTGHPNNSPRWGKAHKDFQRKYYKSSVVVMGPVQEMPVFTNCVDIDPDLKDAWGIPVARLTGRRHPEDFQTAEFISAKASALLKETGATFTYPRQPGLGVSGGQHQAGTCRMGNDPKTSVTDRHCRLHNVDNVFVVDGSVHVTNGGFNPALTIMAVAFWASGYIVREWQGTRFR